MAPVRLHALRWPALVALWAAAPALADDASAAPEPALETRVEARRERRLAHEDRRAARDPALVTATPEDALEAIAGVTLARDGGPLAPARVMIRGLAGPRVRVDVGDLSLSDPVTGELDAALLPLFAAASFTERPGSGERAFGGSLSLAPTESWLPTLRARVGFGTLETLRADLVVGAPTSDGGHVTVGAQLATTQGDFAFVPITRSGSAQGAPAVRRNNDQHRANALLSARTYAGPATVELLAYGAAHEGGIPGFATAPTSGLRGERRLAGASGRLRLDVGDGELSLRGHAMAASRRVRAPSRGIDEGVASATEGVEADIHLPRLVGPVSVGATAGAAYTDLLDGPFSRTTASLAARARARLLGDGLLLDAAAAAQGHSDVGLLPEGHLAVEVGRGRPWTIGAVVSHGERAPSLDELYAPRGLVLGNPDLAPERATDLELYARLEGRPVVDARVAAFAGHMDDAILFLSRSAFEIVPVNTGPVLRAGVEGRVRVTPHAHVGMELVAAALASRVEVTGAPLPTVPPFHSRLSARLGAEEGRHLVVIMRQRADTPATLYGTLAVPGYALFDAVLRWPLGEGLAATAAVTNVFDVQTAQDVNLLPLPGRQLFCTLEVRHD